MRPSRALARRIDRLAVRAHAFHRYAHHPLCERYRGELIAVRGRTRVCRGCTYALLGAGCGAAAGLVTNALPCLPLMAAAVLVSAWALASLQPSATISARSAWSWLASVRSGVARAHVLDAAPPSFVEPRAARGIRQSKLWTRASHAFAPSAPVDPLPGGIRQSKLWTRAWPAFAWAWAFVVLVRSANPLLVLPLVAAISGMLVYRRRGPDRTPCRSCPEQTLAPCSGYLPMLRAERAFVRRSQRLIDAESSSA